MCIFGNEFKFVTKAVLHALPKTVVITGSDGGAISGATLVRATGFGDRSSIAHSAFKWASIRSNAAAIGSGFDRRE